MTTFTDFSTATDTVKENLDKSVKWLQDANQKFVETQKQQIKQVTDLFSKTSLGDTFAEFNKLDNFDKFDNPFANTVKAFTEQYKKNTKAYTDMVGLFFKPVEGMPKFSNFSDQDSIAKETSAQLDKLKNQIEDLTLLNQENVKKLLKQFDESAKSLTPLAEQYKSELEKSFEAYQNLFQEIVQSYSAFAAPSTEPFTDVFNKLNEQVKTNVKENLKFWKTFTKQEDTEKETPKAKLDGAIVKNKKQSPATMN